MALGEIFITSEFIVGVIPLEKPRIHQQVTDRQAVCLSGASYGMPVTCASEDGSGFSRGVFLCFVLCTYKERRTVPETGHGI